MQYLSQRDADALAATKRRQFATVGRTVRTEHRRATERTDYFNVWLAVLLIVVLCAALWIYGHLRSLRTLYRTDVEWWKTRYVRGPRPLGSDEVGLDCLLVSAEYPAFAKAFLSQQCRSLPQTSAIFLLTMIQTFGDEMEGIHYSGSREQLGGARFHTFLKDYGHWNVPDNPWRFLFKSQSSFALSVAVQRAKASPNGDTMLEALFNGGLCAVARQFYKPEVDAPQMCRELLDEQLVYYQSCDAARLASAFNVGNNVGGLVGATVGGAAGRALSQAGGRLAGRLAFSAIADITGEAAGTVGVMEATVAAACAPFVAFFGIGYAACVASWQIAFLATTLAITAVTVATTAATTAVAYAASSCPYSQYYTLVMQPDGSYKKKAWSGDPKELPSRTPS